MCRVSLFLALGSIALFNQTAHADISFFQTGASGGGQQFAFALINPISGTMTAPVPRFNGGLGTLIQADFEFAGSATGTWLPDNSSLTGNSTLGLSGPTDVGGVPMGNLIVGFADPYASPNGSNSFNANFTNLTLTSGAFFNTLTGVGTYPMNWIYSGSTTLDIPATGTGPGNEGFSWGGSVHVLYTYESVAVPSPATVWLGLPAFALLGLRRHRRQR